MYCIKETVYFLKLEVKQNNRLGAELAEERYPSSDPHLPDREETGVTGRNQVKSRDYNILAVAATFRLSFSISYFSK